MAIYDSNTFDSSDGNQIARWDCVARASHLLTMQLLFTIGCIALTSYLDVLSIHISQNLYLYLIGGFFGGIVTIIYMSTSPQMTEPQFAVFTIFQAIALIAGFTIYSTKIIAFAIISTIIIITSLVVYGVATFADRKRYVLILYTWIAVIIVIVFINIFIKSEFIQLIKLCSGAFIMFCYIIIDVQRFLSRLSNNTITVQPDLHLAMAISIYLDIMNVFVGLLVIFGN
jgi:FtsH-binding integral membrane protein